LRKPVPCAVTLRRVTLSARFLAIPGYAVGWTSTPSVDAERGSLWENPIRLAQRLRCTALIQSGRQETRNRHGGHDMSFVDYFECCRSTACGRLSSKGVPGPDYKYHPDKDGDVHKAQQINEA
jgi:hypothetical protein